MQQLFAIVNFEKQDGKSKNSSSLFLTYLILNRS